MEPEVPVVEPVDPAVEPLVPDVEVPPAVVPVAPLPLPIADALCRQPVYVMVWPLVLLCPLVPLVCEPVCAPTPTAMAAAKTVPKRN
jgi:hypothetical protein